MSTGTDLEASGKDSAYGGPENIQNAWRRLAGGAEVAAKALIEIARTGESELARVQASQAILNRVGLQTNSDITVRVIPAEYDALGPSDSHALPSTIIRERMAALRAGRKDPVQDEDVIVEAELVEE